MNSDDKNGFGVDENMNKSETTMDQLRRIAKQTNLIHLNFSPSEEKLILIGTKQQVQDAKMLIKFVWSLRETYKQKEDQVKKDQKKQQKEFDELKKCVKLTFKFNISLTKYVIGLGGDNISKAKKIEGVKHIHVRNTGDETMSECLILATDQNAAEEARAILEMAQDYELIPADPFVRKELIGIEGKNIQELEKRSNVIKICTLEHLKYIRDSSRNYYRTNRQQQNNNNNDQSQQQQQSFINEEEPQDKNFKKLIIIGPREKVPFAKMLIKSQVDLIQQRSALLERKKNALKDIHQQNQTSYYDDDNNNNNNNNDNSNNNNNYGNGDYYNNNNNNNNYGNYNQYDQYDQYDNYDNNWDAGKGRQQQSARRQRKREQQQATEQSNRDTSHFNYVDNQRGNRQQQQQQNYSSTNNNDDPEFPQLGTNPPKNLDSQIESKDISNEDDNQQQEVSWLEHDKAGMEEDEQEQEQSHQQQHQQQEQRHGGRGGGRRYQGSGSSGGGAGAGGGGGGQGGSSYDGGFNDGGYQDDRRRSSYHKKPVWKQKEKSTSSSTEVNNTSSNQ